jgi:cell fate regulator YaaT (PSP1 superfamily)
MGRREKSKPNPAAPSGPSRGSATVRVGLPRFVERMAVPKSIELPSRGDRVVAETRRGTELAVVISATESANGDEPGAGTILRRADDADLALAAANSAEPFTTEAGFFVDRAAHHGLPMKLIGVELLLSGDKLVFHFTAPKRVNFVVLARDCARAFRKRIEFRQIGERDAARVVGGCGSCGYELCCRGSVTDFFAVSIKAAKNQGLAMEPARISGVCGRLKCCLTYEDACYREMRRRMPKVGERVAVAAADGSARRCDACVTAQDLPGGRIEVMRPADDDGAGSREWLDVDALLPDADSADR